jgi:hypothetical protein
MKHILPFLLSLSLSPLAAHAAPKPEKNNKPDPSQICGRIQFVQSFPDFKVKSVQSFADLKVKIVKSQPGPGKWQIVDSMPDYKIQIVNSFPDFTVKFTNEVPDAVKARR